MPLETATYISQLNSANPVHGDQISVDDSHMRLIKATLLATFPGFTAAALNSTQAQLDAAALLVNTNGVNILADAGIKFKTNTTDGFENPAAGTVTTKVGGIVGLTVTPTALTVPGTFAPTGAYLGGTGQLVPTGSSHIWWTDTLPTGYLWCNGALVNRTTYAALFAILGTTYGVGDGSTTFGLPDLRDNVPVGKGTMGATTAIGRITNFTTSVLGNLFGECLHLLGIGEMPSHGHTATVTDPGHTHSMGRVTVQGGSGATADEGAAGATDLTTSATTGISVSNANTGGGGTHNNVQPAIVCNWIIKT